MRRPRETWRRVGPARLAPARAVARPLALLAAMAPEGPPVLSWSCVSAPALVLGRAARDPALDEGAARAAGVSLLRRGSGGGPVLWDAGLLGLDVLLPPGHRLAPRDVVAGYRWLGEAIAAALRALGATGVEVVSVERARAARAEARPAAAACFGGLSPYEVLVDGRKVVGLSQVRRREGALVQAGLALELDAVGLAALLAPADACATLAADLAGGAGGLREYLPGLEASDLVAAVERAVAAREGVALGHDVLDAGERRREDERASSPSGPPTGP